MNLISIVKRATLLIFVITLCHFRSFAQNNNSPNFALAGFATETSGCSGGMGGTIDTVRTGSELQNAINAHKDSQIPLTIIVEGQINLANSSGLDKIDVKDVENLSIIGSVTGAELDGIGIKIRRASSIVIRNITVHHVLSGEKDCISIEGPADHIWIDHCELYNEYGDVDGDGDEDDDDKDYYDGLLDIKKDAEYVTYSWNYLHGSWKTSLAGSSESDTYDRKLTIHHNYYEDCYSRLPLFRGGKAHILNCYYNDIASTAINTRLGACIRIEKNYFENVQNPWVSAYSETLGGAELIDNTLVNCPFDYSRPDTFEPLNCSVDVPYNYNEIVTNVDSVKLVVTQYAGVGKLDNPSEFTTLNINSAFINSNEAYSNKPILYPNPVVTGSTLAFMLENESKVAISLFDISGKRIETISYRYHLRGFNSVPLITNNLPSGIYIISVQTDKSNQQIKFIKK